MSKVIPSIKSSTVNIGNSQAIFTTGTVSSSKTTYTITGTTNVTVPAGVTQVKTKCWGAAGGGGYNAGNPTTNGGGGAYAESTFNVTPGDTLVVTVGAGGATTTGTAGTSIAAGGNNASGNGGGGNGFRGTAAQTIGCGGGGQYSAVHYFTGTNYVLKCAAGGGGGGGNALSAPDGNGGGGGRNGNPLVSSGHTAAGAGAGGVGGIAGTGGLVSPSPGNNYVANATTTGSTAMNLNNGTGGNGGGPAICGGGGGGYGGGGAADSGGGAAGGGCFGDSVTFGGQSNGTVGNSGDVDYVAGKGVGAAGIAGTDGLVVIQFTTTGAIFTSAATLFSGVLGSSELFTSESKALTASVADGNSANIQLTPVYTNSTASAFTVTRHNYEQLNNPTLTNTGGGSIAVTDAAVWKFDAAAGTHKAVDAGTTKTTPGTVDAWIKVNVNGTIYYFPCYTSKTS